MERNKITLAFAAICILTITITAVYTLLKPHRNQDLAPDKTTFTITGNQTAVTGDTLVLKIDGNVKVIQ